MYNFEFLLVHVRGEQYELITLDGIKMTDIKGAMPELAMGVACAWTSCWNSVRIRFEEDYAIEQEKKRARVPDEISGSDTEFK
jgi:hypothetical protein